MSIAADSNPLEHGLTVRAVGPATELGRISLSELARIASSFQATLERLAFSIVGGRRRSGRRPQDIADAVRMDFVGFQRGSAVLNLQRPDGDAVDNLLNESFNALVTGLDAIRREDSTMPQYFTPTVVNGLVTLCGGISRQNITAIEFAGDNHTFFTADAELQRSLKKLQKATFTQEITIVGRLHMGDFDPLGLRCRIDTHRGSIQCDFDDELKEVVIDLFDELVMATGVAELQSDGVSVRVLHLDGLSPVQNANTKSLDELAQEQGVRPVDSIAELRGENVDDFDNFMMIVRSAR
jgi:hypothetical protein